MALRDSNSSADIGIVNDALQKLKLSGSEGKSDLAPALSSLAIQSRTSNDVRRQLADPEVLQSLIEAVEIGLNDSLELTSWALRCVGNASIDNDAARDSIAAFGFGWARSCLAHGDWELHILTVKVLYNICSDHEEAQRACYKAEIEYWLIELGASRLDDDVRTLLVELLFWITGQRANDDAASARFSNEVLLSLLALPPKHSADADVHDLATTIEICLTYLRMPPIQEQAIKCRYVEMICNILELSDRNLESVPADDVAIFTPLSASLIWILSDISAHDSFAQHYSLGGEFPEQLIRLLSVSSTLSDQLPRIGRASLSAACQVLGNLCRASPKADVERLVEETQLGRALWRHVIDQPAGDGDDAMHSISGLLVQLSRPSVEVRELLAQDDNVIPAMRKLCNHATPHVKQDGIRLLRAFGKDSGDNQQRFESIAASLATHP